MRQLDDGMIDESPQPKRRRRWTIIVFAAFLVLVALVVATRHSFNSRAARLRPGMTKPEVFAVMGAPDLVVKQGADGQVALFTPLPFELHAMLIFPSQVFSAEPRNPYTTFPASVEFHGERARRVFVEGREIGAVKN